MKENVIIVNCTIPREAYQIFAKLKDKPKRKGFKIYYGALMKKVDGNLTLEDGFAADGARIADSGSLDKYDFDGIQIGNLFNMFDKFIAQRATDTAVLQFEHRAFGNVRAILLENFCIDIDASHIVDDEGDFSFLLLEKVVQKRRFTRPQIPGDENHRFLILFHKNPLIRMFKI